MTKSSVAIAVLFALMFGRGTFALFADEPVKLVPVLKINKEYDERTVIKPSTIPDAGDGLFALKPIKKNEIIGELGGRLVTAEDYLQETIIWPLFRSARGRKLSHINISIAKISAGR